MKGLAGLGVLGFLGLTCWWLFATHSSEDEGVRIQMAFGNPAGGEIELHVVVGIVMAQRDRVDEETGKTMPWSEWISRHFILKDPSGKQLEFHRANASAVIKQHEVVGTQEFFMSTRLKSGQAYKFDYVPDTHQPERYRCAFIAPAEPQKTAFQLFARAE